VSIVAIREYGLLAKAPMYTPTSSGLGLDLQFIPMSAWNWLLAQASGDTHHKPLVRPSGAQHLQVLNYVGSLVTPCGTQIEILPKHTLSLNDNTQTASRRLLLKMVARVYELNMRTFEWAPLQLFKQPLPELLIGYFLNTVKQLVRRGVRRDYCQVRDEVAYLKGRLQVESQLRQTPGKQHRFNVEYDEFIENRPENRLLHTCLNRVLHASQSVENQRLARDLLRAFQTVPASVHYQQDLRRWQMDRTMHHYRCCKSWCEFILSMQTPFAMAGLHHGLSFLLPMNILFEKYVAGVLQLQLANDVKLVLQTTKHSLIDRHNDRSLFQLKPDMVIEKNNQALTVLDCKWKRLSQYHATTWNSTDKAYDLSQSDFYQLYAYGQKYLSGRGSVFLIYPCHEHFNAPLPAFHFDEALRLFVVGFDLEHDRVVCDDDNPIWHWLT